MTLKDKVQCAGLMAAIIILLAFMPVIITLTVRK